jgi:glycosyltransferase involved in cell wall biosynthesis
VSTIPYGLDMDVFQPRNKVLAREVFGIPQDLKIVMFAAHLLRIHRKGIDALIAALKDLNVPFDVGLASVGTGRLDVEVGHANFPLGELSSERLLSFAYSAADLLVASTREDNFPNVVLEAVACGVPVVAFRVGGIPDLVRPGITGLLAPPNDVGALRKAIETLLVNDDLRANMERECRRIAMEEYRLDLQAERYKGVYSDLLARSQSAPEAWPPISAS